MVTLSLTPPPTVACTMCSSGLSDDEEAPSDMLTFSHLRIDKGDRSNFLGEGGFGEVWRGRYVATTVAVKMYKVASGSEKTKKVGRAPLRGCSRPGPLAGSG